MSLSYLSELHKAIINRFNPDELRRLSFDLDIEFDDLPSVSRINKAMDLVKYMAQRERLPDLLMVLKQHRPQAVWPEIPPDYKYEPEVVEIKSFAQRYWKWLLVFSSLIVLVVVATVFILVRLTQEPERPSVVSNKSFQVKLAPDESVSVFGDELFIRALDINFRKERLGIRINSPGYDLEEVDISPITDDYIYHSSSDFTIVLFDMESDLFGGSATVQVFKNDPIETFEALESALPPDNFIFINYIVQQGDTLASIAEKNNTSAAVLELYGITSEELIPGNELPLLPVANPAYCPGTRSYIVRSGDSAYSIALNFNTTAEAIQQLNNLDSDYTIYTGQVLCIPQ